MTVQRFVAAIVQFAVVVGLAANSPAHAHLMDKQHGTIDFANGGAIFALSVPVSAFDDENNKNSGIRGGDCHLFRVGRLRLVEAGTARAGETIRPGSRRALKPA
jgi:hypothetical protein